MTRVVHTSRFFAIAGLLAALALAGASGCAAEIGDSCQTNVECSPNGDRICDTAQAGGYCTVQGCSAGGCPGRCTMTVALRKSFRALVLSGMRGPSAPMMSADVSVEIGPL